MTPLLFGFLVACSSDTVLDSADTGEPEDTSAPTTWDPRYDAFIAALQADLDESSAYGVSAAILQPGQPDFAWALGTRDAAGTEPLRPRTLMMIGSTTKMFTATGLLQQVEAGRVSLEDSLSVALPGLEFALDDTWAGAISVRDLLTHHGGFVDHVDWAGASDDALLASYMMDTFPASFWLMVPPGTFYNYSNPGWSYAGLIAESVDPEGRAWPDLMREQVFEPLGMDRSYVRMSEAEADGNWAESYGYDDVVNATFGTVDMSNVTDPASQRPAGSSTWTTPSQVLGMARFLMDGDPDVLGEALRPEITAAQVETDFEAALADGAYGRHYGYGVSINPGFVDPDGDWIATPVWCHGGATLSFTSRFCMVPEHGFAVSILASGYGASFERALVTAIATLVEDLPEPASYEVPPVLAERLEDHAGAYTDPYNLGEMIITVEGTALHIEMPLLDLYEVDYTPELYAYTSDIHYLQLQGYWYDLSFLGEPGTPSTYIRNRSFVGIRDDNAQDVARVAPPAPRIPLVPASLPRLGP